MDFIGQRTLKTAADGVKVLSNEEVVNEMSIHQLWNELYHAQTKSFSDVISKILLFTFRGPKGTIDYAASKD